jgi:hypothetical protein
MNVLPDVIVYGLTKETNRHIWVSQWFKWAGWLVVFVEIYLIVGMMPISLSDFFSSALFLFVAILPIYAVTMIASGFSILVCLRVAKIEPSHLWGIGIRFRKGALIAAVLGLVVSLLTFRFVAVAAIGYLLPIYQRLGDIH